MLFLVLFKMFVLSQCFEFEVAFRTAGPLIIEAVKAHIGFLDLFSSVGERIGGVLARRDGDLHLGGQHLSVRALDVFGVIWDTFMGLSLVNAGFKVKCADSGFLSLGADQGPHTPKAKLAQTRELRRFGFAVLRLFTWSV